jgi:proliferating cell nuclear antigen
VLRTRAAVGRFRPARSGTDRFAHRIGSQCHGDFANQETVIECNDSFKGFLAGKYSLKYLNLFTKATGMCSSVHIMQENDNRFLVLKYNVANLGDLKFYLATKMD